MGFNLVGFRALSVLLPFTHWAQLFQNEWILTVNRKYGMILKRASSTDALGATLPRAWTVPRSTPPLANAEYWFLQYHANVSRITCRAYIRVISEKSIFNLDRSSRRLAHSLGTNWTCLECDGVAPTVLRLNIFWDIDFKNSFSMVCWWMTRVCRHQNTS